MMLAEFNPSAWIEVFGLILATLILVAITFLALMDKTVPKVMYPLVLVVFIALGVVPSVIKFKGFQGEFEQKDKTISEVQSAADALGNKLAAAEQRESSFYASLADPEFRGRFVTTLATGGITPHGMKLLIESSSNVADLKEDLGPGDGQGKERG